jgi:hypothetical protein
MTIYLYNYIFICLYEDIIITLKKTNNYINIKSFDFIFIFYQLDRSNLC